MAVYFEPKRQDYTLGIVDMLGRYLLNPMMERSAQAKRFEHEQRLIAEADARKVAEAQRQEGVKNVFIDMLRNGANANPHQQPGSADFIGGAIGAGANMKDLQPFWLPQHEQIDLGGTKMSRPIFPDGQAGEGQQFDVTMTPQQLAQMAIAQKELAAKDWKMRQEVEQGWAGLNKSNQPNYQFMQGYTDGNGNPVMIDPRSGQTRSISGIQPMSNGPNLQDLIKAREAIFGKKDDNNGTRSLWDDGGMTGAGLTPEMQAALQILDMGILEKVGVQMPGNPAPNPAPSSPKGGKTSPKTKPKGQVTMADIDAKAKANGMTREAAMADAEKQGYQIIK